MGTSGGCTGRDIFFLTIARKSQWGVPLEPESIGSRGEQVGRKKEFLLMYQMSVKKRAVESMRGSGTLVFLARGKDDGWYARLDG